MSDTARTTAIVTSLDILRRVVSRVVKLDKQDFGLCPFHEEDTASFHLFVAESRRARYWCQGCGAQGDVINFARRIFDLNFNEARDVIEGLREFPKPIIDLPLLSPELSTTTDASNFCFLQCKNYSDLRSDYEILLEENRKLRERLNIPPFHPSDERSKI